MPSRPACDRLDQLTDQLADLVLTGGVGEFALRGVAAALGTSDRMLLYYFGSKTGLIEAVLNRISERLSAALAMGAQPAPLPAHALLAAMWARLRTSDLAPFMRVWAEVNARGMRGEEPFAAFAAQSLTAWRQWTSGRLEPDAGPSPHACASALLAIVEGAVMQSVTDPDAADEAVRFLVESLRPR